MVINARQSTADDGGFILELIIRLIVRTDNRRRRR